MALQIQNAHFKIFKKVFTTPLTSLYYQNGNAYVVWGLATEIIFYYSNFIFYFSRRYNVEKRRGFDVVLYQCTEAVESATEKSNCKL